MNGPAAMQGTRRARVAAVLLGAVYFASATEGELKVLFLRIT